MNHLSDYEVEHVSRQRAYGEAVSILVPLRCCCERCERLVEEATYELIALPEPTDAAAIITRVRQDESAVASRRANAASCDLRRTIGVPPARLRVLTVAAILDRARSLVGVLTSALAPSRERTLALVVGLAMTASVGVFVSSHFSAARAPGVPALAPGEADVAPDALRSSVLREHAIHPGTLVMPQFQPELSSATSSGAEDPELRRIEAVTPPTRHPADATQSGLVASPSPRSDDQVSGDHLDAGARIRRSGHATAAMSTSNSKLRQVVIAEGGTFSETIHDALKSGVLPPTLPLRPTMAAVAKFNNIRDPNRIAAGTLVKFPSDAQLQQMIPAGRSGS